MHSDNEDSGLLMPSHEPADKDLHVGKTSEPGLSDETPGFPKRDNSIPRAKPGSSVESMHSATPVVDQGVQEPLRPPDTQLAPLAVRCRRSLWRHSYEAD